MVQLLYARTCLVLLQADHLFVNAILVNDHHLQVVSNLYYRVSKVLSEDGQVWHRAEGRIRNHC